jgi:hypothetical protein
MRLPPRERHKKLIAFEADLARSSAMLIEDAAHLDGDLTPRQTSRESVTRILAFRLLKARGNQMRSSSAQPAQRTALRKP